MKGGKMTRKDFIQLAECLGNFKHYLINDNLDIEEDYQGLIDNIKHICLSANKNFDSDRFDNAIEKQFKKTLADCINVEK